MHPEAWTYIERFASDEPLAVLDIGGRDVNGSTRGLFPYADPYTSVDLLDGPGVDLVGDITRMDLGPRFDLVVCVEVLEHVKNWPAIIDAAHAALRPGGRVVVTCAGPGRPRHSGVDGNAVLHPGEHYLNVSSGELRAVLVGAGWSEVQAEQFGWDTRATAIKPG